VGSTGIVGTHDKYKYDPPGVLVGRSGVIGGAILIGQPYWPLNTTLFVKDFRGNEPRWIYYLLKTIDFSGFDSGSAQPSLNRNYIAGISVLLPPLAEQRGIAATLGALDDKIESNRRIASQAWTLVECKYRSITSSAKARTLGDLMSLEYGKALPAATRSPGTVPVYGSSGITGYHSKSLIPGPAVIVGRKGSIGTVHWSADSCYPIDTTFYVRPNVAVSLLACYFALKSLDLSAMNSASAVPGLNRHATLAQYINFADDGLLVKWAQESMPMVNRAITTDRESGLLSSLRDALAPELLSGRIRVPEAQEAVEAVI
jgi:type I restriction enzyme S subunit